MSNPEKGTNAEDAAVPPNLPAGPSNPENGSNVADRPVSEAKDPVYVLLPDKSSVALSPDSKDGTITLSFTKKTNPNVQNETWDNSKLPQYLPPKGNDPGPWQSCRKQVEEYDSELWMGRDRDLDNTLLFAALFSAVVATFAAETFLWLEQDPTDQTVALLQTIAQQLVNGNASAEALDDNAPFIPPPHVVHINIFFFLSLAITLVAALLGIMCKQWLYEHQRHVALPTKDILVNIEPLFD